MSKIRFGFVLLSLVFITGIYLSGGTPVSGQTSIPESHIQQSVLPDEQSFGKSTVPGDTDGDGIINTAELLSVLANWDPLASEDTATTATTATLLAALSKWDPQGTGRVEAPGSIDASSSPTGAEVYLDDVYMGETAVILDDVEVGIHTVKFSMGGYTDCEVQVSVQSGSTQPVSCSLEPVIIEFEIEYQPDPAFVGDAYTVSIYAVSYLDYAVLVSSIDIEGYMDGVYDYSATIDASNIGWLAGTIPSGERVKLFEYTSEVQSEWVGYTEEYFTFHTDIGNFTNYATWTVEPGELPEPGSIYATSVPSGVSVYMDGVYKGLTALSINDVPIGSHTLEFRMDGYENCEKTVIVQSGSSAAVSCTLDEEGGGGRIEYSNRSNTAL